MDISSDSIVTKLNQQATGKAELSYSYFAASIKKGSTSHAPPPKKLTEEEIQELNLQQTQSTSSASAWNAAGTFEERDLSVWVQGAVKDLLVGVRGDEVDGVTASIIDVVSCSGDACQWITRGKTTANFDLIIKLKWSADVEIQGKKVEGTARIPNAAWDELDELTIEIEVTSGDAEIGGRTAKALLPVVRSKLELLLVKIQLFGTTTTTSNT